MLQPDAFDEMNITLGFGQMLYTPTNRERQDLIQEDRPYAGALMMSLGYSARRGAQLQSSQLRIGIVGPAARAEQTQNGTHRLMGTTRFRGWEHQLRNEPVLQFMHERRNRLVRREDADGQSWDFIWHHGVSLGNFATYANIGAEWRIGQYLPDDFGSAPLQPAAEHVVAMRPARSPGWNSHLFAAVDLRWVLHDITLDGNVLHSSHSVDKYSLVGDMGYGVAVQNGVWRVSYTRYHRSREFRGQSENPVYGSITVSRRF